MQFKRGDLVVTTWNTEFIGEIEDIASVAESLFAGQSIANHAIIRGFYIQTGEKGERMVLPKHMRLAVKADFDKMILNLTKKKLLLESDIYKLEQLQKRALEIYVEH